MIPMDIMLHTISNTFSRMEMFEISSWHQTGDNHYLNYWWPSSTSPCGVIGPRITLKSHCDINIVLFQKCLMNTGHGYIPWVQMSDMPHLRQHIEAWWHIYASVNWITICSSNSLSPVRCQAITRTSADLLSIETLVTNFNEIRFKIQLFSFMKLSLKVSSANCGSSSYSRSIYRKTSNLSRTKSQSLNVSCVLAQLSSLNPLKPGVKLRMKI